MAAKKSTKATKVAETAVAVVQPDITTSFSTLDVKALNDAIENIANRDSKLSNKEKKFAVEVVEQWETGVVEQLRDEHYKVTTFLEYVKNFSYNYQRLIDNPEYIEPLRQLVSLAGLDNEVMNIKDAMDNLAFAREEYELLNRDDIDTDESTTKLEKLELQYELSKEKLVKKSAYDKAQRNLNRVVSDFGLKLNKNDDVKTALSKLTSLTRVLNKNKTECATKANAAKLAISIDDVDLREKLNSLITITLK